MIRPLSLSFTFVDTRMSSARFSSVGLNPGCNLEENFPGAAIFKSKCTLPLLMRKSLSLVVRVPLWGSLASATSTLYSGTTRYSLIFPESLFFCSYFCDTLKKLIVFAIKIAKHTKFCFQSFFYHFCSKSVFLYL